MSLVFIICSEFGCPLPCSFIGYKVKVSYFHKNSYLAVELNSTNDNFHLFFYYSSLVVEKRVETLVYDIGGFLAAAGGNMGLMLGLSFLTILITALDWIKSSMLFCAQRVCPKNYEQPGQTKVEKF